MKLLKKSTYPQKLWFNFLGLISSVTLLSYILTLVSIATVAPTILFRPPPKEEQPVRESCLVCTKGNLV